MYIQLIDVMQNSLLRWDFPVPVSNRCNAELTIKMGLPCTCITPKHVLWFWHDVYI